MTERLDHHRGSGQQQITIRHVNVNAEQALVTDQIVAGKSPTISSALLPAITNEPIQMITSKNEPLGVGKKKE